MRGGFALICRASGAPTAVGQLEHVSRQLSRSGRWVRHDAWTGAALFLSGDRPPRRVGGVKGPVIIGDLFSKRDGQRAAPPDLGAAAATCRWLSADAFGRYVALFPGSGRSEPMVYRDPSGAREALIWRSGRLSVVAGGLDPSLLAAAPPGPELDWDQIGLYAVDALSLGVGSGFKDIHAVEPGCLACFTGRSLASKAIWRPRDFLARSSPDLEGSRKALRDAVDRSVGSAAEDDLIVEISGGLDSAIVAQSAARLAKSP